MASTPSAPRKFNRLAGTRIIIFGGTSGIGLSVAQGAVEEGASVFVVSSSGEKVKRAVAQLSDPAQTHSGTPSRVFGALLDLNQGATLESSLRAMFAQLPTVWGGRVEHIVHTAGRFPAKHTLVTQVSYDELHSIADARLVSALLIAKVASKHWTRGGSYTLTGGAFHTRPPPGGIVRRSSSTPPRQHREVWGRRAALIRHGVRSAADSAGVSRLSELN